MNSLQDRNVREIDIYDRGWEILDAISEAAIACMFEGFENSLKRGLHVEGDGWGLGAARDRQYLGSQDKGYYRALHLISGFGDQRGFE